MIIRLRLLRKFAKGDPVIRQEHELLAEAVKKAKKAGIERIGYIRVEDYIAWKLGLIWPEVYGTSKQYVEIKVEK